MLKHFYAVLYLIVVCSFAFSQPVNDGTNPTQPLSRFDVINSFFMDWQEFENDRYYNIFRITGGLSLEKQGINLRLEIPAAFTNVL